MVNPVSAWKAAVSGNFATAANWTNGIPDSGTTEADLLVAGKAYTVTSSAAETVGFLNMASNATLSITGSSLFTVDSSAEPFSNAYNLGTIDIGAGSAMLFGAPDSPSNDSAEIFNNGKVNVTGTAKAAAVLQIGAPWFELNGSGSLVLSSNAVVQADLTGANGTSSTLDNETNTISGSGTIGNGSTGVPAGEGLVLQNDSQATINANAAAALILNTGSNSILNAGTIETTGAGGLVIDSYLSQQGALIAAGTGALTINNNWVQGGGTASIANGGSIVLNNGVLDLGGTISIAKGGSLNTVAGNTTAVGTNNDFAGDVLANGDVENGGTITIANDSTLNIEASIINSGTISMAGSTGPTKLEMFGNGASLYGTGRLVLSDSANNSIVSNQTSEQFSNHSTISGAGTIGDQWLRLVNYTGALIDANDSVGMTIVGVSQGTEAGNYNAGVVETTGKGGLTIDGSFGNAGDLNASGAGALTLKDGAITNGGVLQTTVAGASIILDNETSTDNAVTIIKGSTLSTTAGDTDTLANLFNNGTVNIANGSTLVAENNWDNTGVIDLSGTTSATSLEIQGGLSLNGGGIVDLTNGAKDAITANPNVGVSFFENVNDTIVGAGVIGAANGSTNLSLNNSNKGIIDATGAAGAALTINTGPQQINNNGTIETTKAGGLVIDGAGDSQQNGGTMQQNGLLLADGVGALTLNNTYAQGAGSAEAAIKGASIVLNDSTLNLQGIVSTVVGSSIVAEGTSDELDAGELDNAGAITIESGVTLSMSGTVNNTGTITLAGASGADSVLGVDGGSVTLSGTGNLVLGNNSDGSIVGESAMFSTQFSNSSNISGAGVIGSAGGDQLQFINLSGGVVDANGSATIVKKKVTVPATFMTIYGDTAGPQNVNAGLIETTGAGGLTIFGALENSGALDAAGAGALFLSDATINNGGGVVQTTAAGASIVLDNTTISTGSVTIVAGSTLATTSGDTDELQAVVVNRGTINVADGSTLIGGGNWTNKGVINLNGATTDTTLEVNNNLTLSGGGTLDLLNTNGLWDSIVSNPSGGAPQTFFTNVNDTIEGAGTIGDGSGTSTFNLTNSVNGTIDATGGAGASLTLNTGTNAINNAGVIETTGAGGLTIDSWVYLQGTLVAGGSGALTISASSFVQDTQGAMPNGGGTTVQGLGSVEATKSGASIVLSDSTLNISGTLSTVAGSSVVAAAGTTDEIDDSNDVENAGSINVDDAATLYLNAWINNSGTVNVGDAAGTGSATVELDSWGAQIFGSGSLILGDNAGNLIESQAGLTQVNFYNSGLISGAGTIGDADLSFQNLSGGVVDANDTVGLTIISSTPVANGLSAAYNAGLIETTGSGGLTIEGTPVTGQADFINAGIIDAVGSGALTLESVTDTSGGGTVETTGTGSIVLDNDSSIATGILSISAGGSLSTTAGDRSDTLEVNTFNQGTINVVNNSSLIVDAHWQNSGSIDVEGSSNATKLIIATGNTWELQADGTLTLSGADASIVSGGAGTDLDNFNNTIQGQGVIGDANMTIDNRTGATIDANGANSLTINATAGSSGNSFIYNSGTMELTGAGGLTITSAMQNFGQLIDTLGNLDVEDAVTGNGVAQINGTGSIEFGAEVDNDVVFGANAQGTVIFDNSTPSEGDAPFFGSISGFKVGDTIDLRDLTFTQGSMSVAPASNFGSLDASLTVTNGATNSAAFYLLGAYTSGQFQFSSDNHGGTAITLTAPI